MNSLKKYKTYFDNNYQIFKMCLEYLEDHGDIHIVRADFDVDCFLYVDIL
jgi:hypothetical protein|nr:MAG TPA: Chromosome region maintenance protein [Caudoviricetes sp.]